MSDFLNELGVLALGSRLRRLGERFSSSVSELYSGAGIDFEPRWFPLYRLLAERGEQNVGEAARALGWSQAAVSQVAREMVARGVAVSQSDPGDRRRRRLGLTTSGRKLEDALEPVWQDLRLAAEQLQGDAGVDLLDALSGIEGAAARRGLAERSRDARRARLLERVEIVPYAPELRSHFERLNREWIERHFWLEPVDLRVLSDPEAHVLVHGGGIWFARLDAEIVGTVGLRREDPTSFELTKMAVSEAYRGREAGRALVVHALAAARERGAKRVFLVTNTEMQASVGLYESLGFRVTRRGADPTYERGNLAMELVFDAP